MWAKVSNAAALGDGSLTGSAKLPTLGRASTSAGAERVSHCVKTAEKPAAQLHGPAARALARGLLWAKP
jgi:hypothetical protein